MDKLAQIRDSEVRGVLAAFVDNGLIKVASREDFDALSAVVADNVGYDYDINDIAEVTGAVLNGQVKTAAEEVWNDYKDAIGELYLMKTAGEISKRDFEAAAQYLVKEAADEAAGAEEISRTRKALNYIGDKVNGAKETIRGKASSARGSIEEAVRNLLSAIRNHPVKASAISAGLVGAGAAGKYLYDKLTD